jgi:ribosomal protein S18 acetylase RimI-like enzyme
MNDVSLEKVSLLNCYKRWGKLSIELDKDMNSKDSCIEVHSENNLKAVYDRFLRTGFTYCLFALANGEDVGFALYSEHNQHIDINELYVKSEFRNNGIGTTLIDYIKNESDGRDIYLGVIGGNERALSFYSRMGFKITRYELSLDEKN